MCSYSVLINIQQFPTIFLHHFIWCIRCFWGPLSTGICVCEAGNAVRVVWQQRQNLTGNPFLQKERKKNKKTAKKKTPKTENDSSQKWLMTGGFLEMSCSRVYAEYFRHLGKRRRGVHICARGVERRTQCMCLNPCHKSMSAWQTRRHSEAYSL